MATEKQAPSWCLRTGAPLDYQLQAAFNMLLLLEKTYAAKLPSSFYPDNGSVKSTTLGQRGLSYLKVTHGSVSCLQRIQTSEVPD